MSGLASGASWMVFFRLIERSLGLVSTLILARLLVPADFGIVAMAMSVVAFIELASAFSLDVPLIQHPDPTTDHYNTAWTLNVLFASGCAVAIGLLAWPAAAFYNEDRLGPVLLILAAGWLVQGFENIGIVNFRRNMDFARETRFLLGKKLSGFCVTLACALAFRSYWALVAGVVAGRTMGMALSYGMASFRPRFSLVARADLLSVSGWLFVNNLLYFGTTRVSHFIIGRILGARSLGLYTLGSEFAYLPQTELVAPINRALFPGFSRMADQPDEMRRMFVMVNSVVAMIVFPAAVGLATVADTLVPVLLGQKWAGAAPVLQILAVAGALSALTSNTYSAYLALGKARIVTWILVVDVVVLIAGMLALARPYGLVGVASAELIAIAVGTTCSIFLLMRTLRVRATDFVANLLRPALAAFGMGMAVVALAKRLPGVAAGDPGVVDLLALVGSGAITYATLIVGLWLVAGRPQGGETLLLGRLQAWRAKGAGADDVDSGVR